MTYLSATTAMIEVFGREAAPSTNPEYNLAVQSGVLAGGGIRGWFGRTTIGKALAALKADRDMNVAIRRLSDLSPHLLADIGMVETPALVEETLRIDLLSEPVPVAPRPAQRPAIQVPQRAPARSTTKPPVRAARKDQRVAQ